MSFSSDLLKWYHKNKRDLPWRGIHDPYQTWISEIMLQQTTVATVIPRFDRWRKVFPNVQSLARAPLRRVLKEWQGLGYYNRAKNLHLTARIICRDFNGRIPAERSTLLKFPGFGPYTAGAVASIAYQKREPIVDANIRRVMMRIHALPGGANGIHDGFIYRELGSLMPARAAGNFNQALMELGAVVCAPRKPLCLQCPVRRFCRAYEKGIQETIPLMAGKTLQEVSAVIALIENDGRYLIQQRPSKGLLGDLWEFPGGKIIPGETPRQAVSREVREEIGCEVVSARPYMKTRHFYTEYKVGLDVWECRLRSLPELTKKQRWAGMKEFGKYPFVSGSVKIIEKLKKDKYENRTDK